MRNNCNGKRSLGVTWRFNTSGCSANGEVPQQREKAKGTPVVKIDRDAGFLRFSPFVKPATNESRVCLARRSSGNAIGYHVVFFAAAPGRPIFPFWAGDLPFSRLRSLSSAACSAGSVMGSATTRCKGAIRTGRAVLLDIDLLLFRKDGKGVLPFQGLKTLRQKRSTGPFLSQSRLAIRFRRTVPILSSSGNSSLFSSNVARNFT